VTRVGAFLNSPYKSFYKENSFYKDRDMERQARKPLFLSPTLNYTSVRKEKKGELFLLKKTKKKKKIEAATFMVSLFNHFCQFIYIYIYIIIK
jgi:hypothetical protein